MSEEIIYPEPTIPDGYKELAPLLKDEWDFIVKFHPDYSRSDDVAALDDLDCLIGYECDEEKEKRLIEIYGSDPQQWRKDRDYFYKQILIRSIENLKRMLD